MPNSNNKQLPSALYLVVQLEKNNGQKMIVSGSKIFKTSNKDHWMDRTGLNFYVVDKDLNLIYSFSGNSQDVKAWIKIQNSKAIGWCFGDKKQCGSEIPWELKDLMFKFSHEEQGEWKNMYVNKCKSNLVNLCYQDQISFAIERVVYKR